VPRFDRSDDGGRRGVVSTESLTAAALDPFPRDRPSGAAGLLRDRWIDIDTATTIQVLFPGIGFAAARRLF
jgi:hypothetical protein